MIIWSSDTDTDDGEPRRSGLRTVGDGSASTLQQAALMYLHSCSGANEGGRTTGGHRSNACQLTSSDAIAAPPTSARDVAHTEQPEPDRAHVLDVQTNCHPGPSFRRDDGGKCP